MTETISGVCPFCRSSTQFRELTFTENVSSLFSSLGGAITGGLMGKAKVVGTAIEVINEDREMPNYICMSCGKTVMQCNSCNEIIPYADSGAAHVCHSGDGAAKAVATGQLQKPQARDDIATLKKLAELHRDGVLSDQEFYDKKADILKRM